MNSKLSSGSIAGLRKEYNRRRVWFLEKQSLCRNLVATMIILDAAPRVFGDIRGAGVVEGQPPGLPLNVTETIVTIQKAFNRIFSLHRYLLLFQFIYPNNNS